MLLIGRYNRFVASHSVASYAMEVYSDAYLRETECPPRSGWRVHRTCFLSHTLFAPSHGPGC